MTIYERIKLLREQQGISQQALAEKIGFKTASAINKIELGLRDINQSKVIAFAKALNTTPAYLMGWEDETPNSDFIANFGARLKTLRTQSGLTQTELAEKLGISFSAISMYERGERSPDFEILVSIADCFNVTIDYLLGKTDSKTGFPSNVLPLPKTYKVPLLGTIACGEPILAEENITDIIDVPEHIKADFALRCKGDSMIDARINDGDIVYIKQQPTVENGQIAAVLIEDEATLKRVYFSDNRVTLMACNPRFAPLIYSGSELERLRIIGRAIAYTSIIK